MKCSSLFCFRESFRWFQAVSIFSLGDRMQPCKHILRCTDLWIMISQLVKLHVPVVMVINWSLPLLLICLFLEAALPYENSNSGLTEVPTDIPENSTEIILDTNDITSLTPDQFNAFPELTKVSLKQNEISSVPDGAFNGTLLSILNMIQNALVEVPNLTVVCDSLTELHLQQNKINSVDNLRFLHRLKRIYLNRNQLADVPYDAFAGMISLLRFGAIGNMLETIPNLTDVYTNTVLFELNYNNFTCDCRLSWIVQQTRIEAPLLCTRPDYLLDTPLSNLTRADLICTDTSSIPDVTNISDVTSLAEMTYSPSMTGLPDQTSSHQPTSRPDTTSQPDATSSLDVPSPQDTLSSSDETINSRGSTTAITTISPADMTPSVLPTEGIWLEWQEWGIWLGCPVTCGGAEQYRFMLCSVYTLEEIDHQGITVPADCPDAMYLPTSDFVLAYSLDSRQCGTQQCPVDGVWSPWSVWDSCTASCGLGTQSRYRTCQGPDHGGEQCEGSERDTATCDMPSCDSAGSSVEQRREELLPTEVYTAADQRTSAVNLGTLGIVLVTLLFGGILLQDIPHIYRDFKRAVSLVKKRLCRGR